MSLQQRVLCSVAANPAGNYDVIADQLKSLDVVFLNIEKSSKEKLLWSFGALQTMVLVK